MSIRVDNSARMARDDFIKDFNHLIYVRMDDDRAPQIISKNSRNIQLTNNEGKKYMIVGYTHIEDYYNDLKSLGEAGIIRREFQKGRSHLNQKNSFKGRNSAPQ